MKFTAVISIVISLQYYYGINTLIICDVRWVRCAIKMPYNAFDKLNYTLIFEWKCFMWKNTGFFMIMFSMFFSFIHFLLLLTTHHKLKRIEIQSHEYTLHQKCNEIENDFFYFVCVMLVFKLRLDHETISLTIHQFYRLKYHMLIIVISFQVWLE